MFGEKASHSQLTCIFHHSVCCLCACVYFITLGYTVPVRCHHDPREFSDTCRWCRCPIPEGKRGEGFVEITFFLSIIYLSIHTHIYIHICVCVHL